LKDRYGSPPPPVENLIYLKKLAVSASRASIFKIASLVNGFKFFPQNNLFKILDECNKIRKMMKYIKNLRFDQDQSIRVLWNLPQDTPEKEKINLAYTFIDSLAREFRAIHKK